MDDDKPPMPMDDDGISKELSGEELLSLRIKSISLFHLLFN
jgi:hypothetical protein